MKKVFILSLFILLSASTPANDRPDVKINDVDIAEVYTPVYQSDDGEDTVQVQGMVPNSTGNRKWFRMVTEFETRPEWLDKLTLEYYVLMPSPDKQEVLFKGTVNYVDIPKGRDHLSEMYMHFNSYERHYGRGKIEYAVVALMDGKEMALETSRKEPKEWWKSITPHPCELLNRLDTPFRVISVEKYEAQNRCVQSQ